MTILDGDVLLFNRAGFYGWLIRRKTWHDVTHTELYIGNGKTVASRNGIGTGLYDIDTAGLVAICRPKLPVNIRAIREWMLKTGHRPYGWTDIFKFAGIRWAWLQSRGIVCSPFVVEALRAGGCDPFPGEDAELVAPFEFAISPVFDVIPYRAGADAPQEVV